MRERPPHTWQSVATMFLLCATIVAVVWIVAGCGSTEDSTEPVPTSVAAVPPPITQTPTTGPEPTPPSAPPMVVPQEAVDTPPAVTPQTAVVKPRTLVASEPVPVAPAPRPAPQPVVNQPPRVQPAPEPDPEPVDETPVNPGCPPGLPGFQNNC
jgi:outer membrane biosynthesis protein TonB